MVILFWNNVGPEPSIDWSFEEKNRFWSLQYSARAEVWRLHWTADLSDFHSLVEVVPTAIRIWIWVEQKNNPNKSFRVHSYPISWMIIPGFPVFVLLEIAFIPPPTHLNTQEWVYNYRFQPLHASSYNKLLLPTVSFHVSTSPPPLSWLIFVCTFAPAVSP